MKPIRLFGVVVIAIAFIAIALGLLFPARVGPVAANALKVEAHNDETEIVGAVNAYFVEYQRYPIDPSKASGPVVFSADNHLLLDVLLNRSGTKDGNPLNPRGEVFLNPPLAKDQAHPKAGLQTSTGIWFDPWGSPYHIAIDASHEGELNGKYPIPGFYTDVGPIKTGVIVWSYGKNGELGGGPATKPGFSSEHGVAGKFLGSGDVVSWQ
jgi:hypothetical protein